MEELQPMETSERSYDGAIGEGWWGRDPDGCHVNVVLARRGGATAAALMTAFTTPRPGHSPILVCVGNDKDHYEPVWPPTVMMNKSTLAGERHAKITYGATQLGIGQGVLDAVADGLLPPTDDAIVFVAVWIDTAAGDETAVRDASRRATRKAVGMAVSGRDPDAARSLVERRDALRNPYYSGA
jgi:5,6,7,8-tetrahydromethanopterin hydro-lyase